jgi:magnesium transporter
MVAPDATEIDRVRNHVPAPAEFFTDPLDVDERARYEVDGDWTLMIIRIPFQSQEPDASVPFVTIPLGIIWGFLNYK